MRIKIKKNIYYESDITQFRDEEFKRLNLNNLSFRYEGTNKFILKNIDLEIKNNSLIGFIGTSGSGKTTLIDCILGLLQPSDGEILFNNRNIFENLKSWQKKIGYVPQNIYLMDASIRNIAINHNDRINQNKILNAIKLANLSDFIEQLPDKLNTIVGEKGVKISGGQRQRIGIARALYNNFYISSRWSSQML